VPRVAPGSDWGRDPELGLEEETAARGRREVGAEEEVDNNNRRKISDRIRSARIVGARAGLYHLQQRWELQDEATEKKKREKKQVS
jgi:hypothetical protein